VVGVSWNFVFLGNLTYITDHIWLLDIKHAKNILFGILLNAAVLPDISKHNVDMLPPIQNPVKWKTLKRKRPQLAPWSLYNPSRL
jgi:hypothetical protein